MRDDDHLVILRQRPERLANDLTGSSTDPDVDLVKNQGGSLVGFGEDRLHRQHEPCRLATRGDLTQRLESFAGVRSDQKRYAIHSRRINQESLHGPIAALNWNSAGVFHAIE